MEEIEVPTEQLQEEMHHHAEHAPSSWISGVALSSALLAVLAAVSALLAGHHANEAMLDQMHATDHWSYYQAKGIKGNVLAAKLDLLTALGKPVSEKDQEKVGEYKKEQDEISTEAKELEKASSSHMEHHVIFARGVTLFQVAIGIAAISVLTRRRRFWFVALAFGLGGVGFLLQGLLLASS
jgi:Domain of unknown function (DUF4337)